MPDARRIVVIGGGIGGLSTAYEIIRQQPDCEITIFQMGWRLGGKCSASRSPAPGPQRIEEHGIHAFFGCYENAFHLMQRVYADLDRNWREAFHPQSSFTLYDEHGGDWDRWEFRMPVLPGAPGERLASGTSHGFPTLLQIAKALVALLTETVVDYLETVNAPEPLRAAIIRRSTSARDVIARLDAAAGEDIEAAIRHLEELFERLLSLDPQQLPGLARRVGARLESRSTFRKVRVLAELGLAGSIGLLRAYARGTSLTELDEQDLTEWLHANAIGGRLSDVATHSAPLRMVYEASFAFENGDPQRPNMGAGTAIYVATRVLFDYRGALSYKMRYGSAETLATPLYRALLQRNVRFEFFHRLDEITLTPDGENVATLSFTRQAELLEGGYQPLVDGSDRWPDQPKYDLLRNGDVFRHSQELEYGGYDLEDPRTAAPSFGRRTITWSGVDPGAPEVFDRVILAIPPAASEPACAALKRSPRVGDRWRRMYERIQTTPTQSCQLWFDRTAEQMGWISADRGRRGAAEESALVGCYEQPFGNWADLTIVLPFEDWPVEVSNVAYLCGMLLDSEELDAFDPPKWRQTVRRNAEEWVTAHAHRLWPNLFVGGDFAWDSLVDVDRHQGRDRFATQFFRANLSPSSRYVLSVKGTTTDRMTPGGSGFANLFLAGDWTRNGANNGCVEATTMSARQSARALLGLRKDQLPVHGED